MSDILDKIKNLVFPKRCACCSALVLERRLLCEQCEVRISAERNKKIFCYTNRRHFPSAYFRSFEFDGCIAPFIYSGTVRNGLHGFKFRGKIDSAGFFAKEMAECIKAYLPEPADAVVFVPLSKKRRAKRGYDQAALLAEKVAFDLGLPLLEDAIEKLWDNSEQHNSAYFRRFGNIFGVYEAKSQYCRGKRLLLVDDITTTGATFNECAKMLKLAGADAVYCIAAACVPKKEKQ